MENLLLPHINIFQKTKSGFPASFSCYIMLNDQTILKSFLSNLSLLKTIFSFRNYYIKIFLNNIPVNPPLFHKNKFLTDFKKKAELFNSFFAKQCFLIKNDSKQSS